MRQVITYTVFIALTCFPKHTRSTGGWVGSALVLELLRRREDWGRHLLRFATKKHSMKQSWSLIASTRIFQHSRLSGCFIYSKVLWNTTSWKHWTGMHKRAGPILWSPGCSQELGVSHVVVADLAGAARLPWLRRRVDSMKQGGAQLEGAQQHICFFCIHLLLKQSFCALAQDLEKRGRLVVVKVGFLEICGCH